jgi:hypothetical protein
MKTYILPMPALEVVHLLQAQSSAIKRDFDQWLADMRARHPWKPEAAPPLAQVRPEAEEGQMSNRDESSEKVKEAVGVFSDAKALEAAVDELEVSGFDRAAMSILATDTKGREQVERFYRTVRDIEDSGRAPHGAFVSRDSRTEGEAAVVGLPIYVGGCAGAAAVAATGGALAFAIAAALLARSLRPPSPATTAETCRSNWTKAASCCGYTCPTQTRRNAP